MGKCNRDGCNGKYLTDTCYMCGHTAEPKLSSRHSHGHITAATSVTTSTRTAPTGANITRSGGSFRRRANDYGPSVEAFPYPVRS